MKKQKPFSRVILAVFFMGFLVVIGIKAVNEGWFAAREPLELNGKPALVLFNRYNGCECELVVYEAAENQVENWTVDNRSGVPVYVINLDHRSDLKTKYQIIRAPTLILLDAFGNIILKQEEGISDEEPLNLPLFEEKIKGLLADT